MYNFMLSQYKPAPDARTTTAEWHFEQNLEMLKIKNKAM